MSPFPIPLLTHRVPAVYRRFLLLCLRSRWSGQSLDEARTLGAAYAIDWTLLGQLAVHEGVAPLLYASVRSQGLTPQWLEQELRQVYDLNAIRNVRLLHELALALQALEQAGIAAIVLKGAALADTLYGNIALRPMFDLDVLVPHQSLSQAVSSMADLGYVRALPEAYEGVTFEYENEILLHKRGQLDVALELHWSLIDSPHYQRTIDMDWFWQTSKQTRLAGCETMVLSPEALVLHLCAHVALHHQGRGMLWLHDLAMVIGRYREVLDWQMVIDRATTYDLVIPLQRIVSEVAQEWYAPVPDVVLHRLHALRPSYREMRSYAWMSAPARPVAQRFWADLVGMRERRGQLRYAFANLFPSQRYMQRRYGIPHPLLTPLYYPIRWLRGLESIRRIDRDARSSETSSGTE